MNSASILPQFLQKRHSAFEVENQKCSEANFLELCLEIVEKTAAEKRLVSFLSNFFDKILFCTREMLTSNCHFLANEMS